MTIGIYKRISFDFFCKDDMTNYEIKYKRWRFEDFMKKIWDL